MQKQFDREAIEKTSVENKIGLLSTLEEDGCPHVTFISSLQANAGDEVTWGQFCPGESKKLVEKNPKTGFLMLTNDMELWRGTADYLHSSVTGPVMDSYSNKPIFRYNSYFGFNKVHYMRLNTLREKASLSIGGIVKGALLSKCAALFCSKKEKGALSHISKAICSAVDGLKFIAYENADGYPEIVPVIQATAAGTDRIVFSLSPFKEDVLKIPENREVALFGTSLKMESVLVSGVYTGIKRRGFVKAGLIEIERVYNPMPPQSAVIYPKRTEFTPVTEF